jgi:biotin carboxyl carrier protein
MSTPGPRRLVVRPLTGEPPSIVEPKAAAEGPAARAGQGTVGAINARPGGAVRVEVLVDGWRFELDVEDARRAELRERATRRQAGVTGGGPREVRAIIPGRIISVAVVAGDAVSEGQALLVVEAMKMQNELRAPRDGMVERVAVGPGATVELGDVLLVLV